MSYMPFTSRLPEHSLVRSHRVFTESVKTEGTIIHLPTRQYQYA